MAKKLAKGVRIILVKKASFIPILGQTQFHNYSNVVSNVEQNLVFSFSVKGKNASSFGKEIGKKVEEWELDSAQKLHQEILDLLSFCRDENLEIEFATSLLIDHKIAFATFSGEILLKRNGQTKNILASDNEIAFVIGSFLIDDQIVLLNKSAQELSRDITELLNVNVSQEKLVSQITIENSKSHNNNAIAFVEYLKEEIKSNKKFDLKDFLNRSKNLIITVSKKIIFIFKKIFNFLKKNLKALKEMDKKKLRNRILIFLAAFILIFAFFSFRNSQNKKAIQKTETNISNILSKMESIDTIIASEPITARQITTNTLSELEELNKITDNKNAQELIQVEIEKLQKLINEISGENNLDKLSVAYDLSQKSPEFLANKIKIKENDLYILGNNGQEILKINLSNSTNNIQSIKSETTIRDLTISEGNIFFLETGISMLQSSEIPNNEDFNLDNLEELKEEGDSDRSGEFLNSFGPYLYLVNTEKRNIYRYYYNNDELSDPIGWLIDKSGISFDQISSFLVNGDLYLAFKNGEIMKFEKGEPLDFQIQGLENAFEESLILAGQEEIDKVAILEKKNKRLVIISADGQVFSEIKSNELAAVSDIALSKDGQSIYAISGSVVYKIQI